MPGVLRSASRCQKGHCNSFFADKLKNICYNYNNGSSKIFRRRGFPYIDLVFYNIELKCYVLIDLKMGTITHQDVGQIDMYVRMYDDLKCKEGDNPTIGILLCGETSEDIARYSVLHDNDHLFMSKYLTYLPTKEQLRDEIERQKNIFYMQHPTLEKKSDNSDS